MTSNEEFYEYFLYDPDQDTTHKIPKNILVDNKIDVKTFKEHLGKKTGWWQYSNNPTKSYMYRIGIWENLEFIGTGIWVIKNEDDFIDFSMKPRIDIKIVR
jgi:hypothetical protein